MCLNRWFGKMVSQLILHRNAYLFFDDSSCGQEVQSFVNMWRIIYAVNYSCLFKSGFVSGMFSLVLICSMYTSLRRKHQGKT